MTFKFDDSSRECCAQYPFVKPYTRTGSHACVVVYQKMNHTQADHTPTTSTNCCVAYRFTKDDKSETCDKRRGSSATQLRGTHVFLRTLYVEGTEQQCPLGLTLMGRNEGETNRHNTRSNREKRKKEEKHTDKRYVRACNVPRFSFFSRCCHAEG